MATKCAIVKICGVKRKVCRKANGQIKSSTVVGKAAKRGKRKAKKAKKSTRKATRKTTKRARKSKRSRNPKLICQKVKLNGKCREVCYVKHADGAFRIATNKPAKACKS